MCPFAKDRQEPQDTGGLSLQRSEQVWLCPHRGLRYLASRTTRRHFCGFKPPSLWSFVRWPWGQAQSLKDSPCRETESRLDSDEKLGILLKTFLLLESIAPTWQPTIIRRRERKHQLPEQQHL